jgi:hypothetical protein
LTGAFRWFSTLPYLRSPEKGAVSASGAPHLAGDGVIVSTGGLVGIGFVEPRR